MNATRSLMLFLMVIVDPLMARASDEPVQGFTEPYSKVEVATAEMGLITILNVKEGDHVTAGQALAVLDDDLQQSQVTISQQQAEATGKLKVAESDVALHTRRLEKLTTLARNGQAHPEEVERVKSDLQAASGRLLAEQEERKLMQLQLERAKLQLAKRTIVAPLEGVIVELLKQRGEFVAPSAPQVLTLVRLDQLKATFLVDRERVQKLSLGAKVIVHFADSEQETPATVEYVSPVTDAESGTTVVRVVIANASGKYRSGERCLLGIIPGDVAAQPSNSPR